MICSKKTSGALDFNHLFVETIEIKGTVVKTAPDSMADVPVCYTESLPYFYEIILLAKSKFVNFYEMLTVSVLLHPIFLNILRKYPASLYPSKKEISEIFISLVAI